MKAICVECGKKQEVVIDTQVIKEIFEGVELEYEIQVARCKECGTELYVGEIFDANLQCLYNAYRKKMGIITVEEIRALTKKYDIGIRNLSKILDFGEHAIENFLEGYIPSQAYSDTMKEVLNNQDKFLEKLKRNKHRISNKVYICALKELSNIKLNYENRFLINQTICFSSYQQNLLSA